MTKEATLFRCDQYASGLMKVESETPNTRKNPRPSKAETPPEGRRRSQSRARKGAKADGKPDAEGEGGEERRGRAKARACRRSGRRRRPRRTRRIKPRAEAGGPAERPHSARGRAAHEEPIEGLVGMVKERDLHLTKANELFGDGRIDRRPAPAGLIEGALPNFARLFNSRTAP